VFYGEEREDKLVAMGEMCASIAHEIRNPLGSMELFCSLLEKDLRTQPELLHLAEQVHTGIRAINRIITNCLSFSSSATPQRECMADVEGYLRSVAALSGDGVLPVTIDHTQSAEPVVDPYLLQQALNNLLRNAIEAAGSNGSVQLRSCVDSQQWMIEVTDNGAGMTAEEQARIFEPFYTTKRGGTGLGLAITFAIVRAHGGEISVQSEVGKGTKFTVTIPAGEEA
jgi:signal transduction histidine kinase